MVATSECADKNKPITGNKVSKPLMEKKRRARINKCLDQLKTLLESYYSSSIRKRKLEKADILELTVKHLRNLQKIQSCHASASDFSDHQLGFRSCIANVNQYLMMADHITGNDHWMLSQLSRKLCGSSDREEVFSTKDSGLRPTDTPEHAQRLLPSAVRPDGSQRASCKALKVRRSSKTQCSLSEGAPREAPAPHISTHRKSHPVSDAASAQENVWRPW